MPTMNLCPHCNSMYDKRKRIENEYCCPVCFVKIERSDVFKICPACDGEFKRFNKVIKFDVLDIDNRPYTIKGGYCPHCGESLVYRKDRSGVTAITLDERLTADHLIQALNAAIRRRTNSRLHDLDEATGRERLAAYRLISWADGRLDSYAKDVGRTVHEFLEGMVLFIFNNIDWYKNNADSFLAIWNQKAKIAGRYYEYEMTRHAELTGRDKEIQLKLQKLVSMM